MPEEPRCYCGRYEPDDLCPCTRMARDMRQMEREERQNPKRKDDLDERIYR